MTMDVCGQQDVEASWVTTHDSRTTTLLLCKQQRPITWYWRWMSRRRSSFSLLSMEIFFDRPWRHCPSFLVFFSSSLGRCPCKQHFWPRLCAVLCSWSLFFFFDGFCEGRLSRCYCYCWCYCCYRTTIVKIGHGFVRFRWDQERFDVVVDNRLVGWLLSKPNEKYPVRHQRPNCPKVTKNFPQKNLCVRLHHNVWSSNCPEGEAASPTRSYSFYESQEIVNESSTNENTGMSEGNQSFEPFSTRPNQQCRKAWRRSVFFPPCLPDRL